MELQSVGERRKEQRTGTLCSPSPDNSPYSHFLLSSESWSEMVRTMFLLGPNCRRGGGGSSRAAAAIPSLGSNHSNFKGRRTPTCRPCRWSKQLATLFICITVLCELRWKSSLMVNGLPLVTLTETNDMLLQLSGNVLASGVEHQVNDDDDEFDESPLQTSTSFFEREQRDKERVDGGAYYSPPLLEDFPDPSRMIWVRYRLHPRRKKGLTYLTKYYSEAVLNNSTPHTFFGISTGSGRSSRNNSRESLPEVARRKLSFYPPLTSNSLLTTPWSRGGSGRPSKIRLRWGK